MLAAELLRLMRPPLTRIFGRPKWSFFSRLRTDLRLATSESMFHMSALVLYSALCHQKRYVRTSLQVELRHHC